MKRRSSLCLLALGSLHCGAPIGADASVAADGGDAAIADRTPIDTPAPDATMDDGVIDADPSDTSDIDSAPADVEAPDASVDDAAMDSGVSFDVVAMDVRSDSRVDARSDAPVPADARSDAATDGSPPDPPGTWRSTLFPRGWLPLHAGGAATSDGKFLHDFSFAGYRRGEAPPVGMGAVRATLVASAFGDGRDDAAPAIQTAINNACAMGGGVILLGAGTFRLRFPTGASSALRIACSNLVLRGSGSAGASQTRLFLDDPTNARTKSLLLVRPSSGSATAGDAMRPERRLVRDALTPTRTLFLEAVDGIAPGDVLTVRNNITDAFRAAHRMNAAATGMGDFWPSSATSGLYYTRRVVSVDAAARSVTLDAPTRYPLEMRDNARAFEPSGLLSEVGVERLAIGMREHMTSATAMPGRLGDSADTAYDTVGTAAYNVSFSSAIRFDQTRDSWLVDVRTYQPPGNTSGAHVLSLALFITDYSHRITVDRCQFEQPQYRGGGGNGYLFLVQGYDNLISNSRAVNGRHNYILSSSTCSGNVFVRDTTVTSRYSDDSHRQLSHANLFDGIALDRAWLQAVNRGTTSSGAGHTATQTVFWNTRVTALHPSARSTMFPSGFAIETAQWGHGYAIATQGTGAAVSTASVTNSYWSTLDPGLPRDHVEGVSMGATVYPQSLYDEQLRLRALRGGY